MLLHGLMEDRRSFEPLLAGWCADHHVFALDLRGHGASDWTPGAYALNDDADDVLALLAERVLSCVGKSMSPTVDRTDHGTAGS